LKSQPTVQPPLHVAAADDEVVFARREHEARQVPRRVAEVGVHLADAFVAAFEGEAEAGQVGGAEALLALAVQHVDARIGGGEAVGDRTGAVRRAVVDDEHVGVEVAWIARTIGSRLSFSL
jgi:hypothetical protein